MLRGRISISLRLTIWFGGIFLAGWVLFGMTMWLNLKHTLADERYLTLSRRIDRLGSLLDKSEDAGARFDDFKEFAHATGGGLAKIFRADGSRVLPSPTPAAQAFPWPAIAAGTDEKFYHVIARQPTVLGADATVYAEWRNRLSHRSRARRR